MGEERRTPRATFRPLDHGRTRYPPDIFEAVIYIPRCIGAYSLSPRIVRARGADAYTPILPHQPSLTATRKSNYTSPLSAWCCSVSCCAGSSVQFGSNYTCLLSPFAYLCTRPSRRSVSAVRAALPGLFLVCVLPIPLCVTDVCTTTVYCFFCYNYRKQQQHEVSVIYTASRKDSSSTILQQLLGGS